VIYITIECRVYNCLDGIKAWAPELHHGFTTQGQPWRLPARAYPRPSPRQLEDLWWPSASSQCFSFVSAAL
jgi:hypothetical protein